MLSQPKVVERPVQPYVGILSRVTMDGIAGAVDESYPRLFEWLNHKMLEPAAAPFIKYNVIDMARELEIECGVPIDDLAERTDGIIAGLLPQGRYAMLTHTGPYDELVAANGALLEWIAGQGLVMDVEDTDRGDRFGCRLEIYETDPATQADSAKWVTEVAIRLRG